MKVFTSSRITKKDLQKLICKTAKELGVSKVALNANGKYVKGSYNAFNNVLYLNLDQTKKELLNTFFHELGHHFAVKNNRWKSYHFNLNPSITIEQVFCIENNIDKQAKILWNKWVNLTKWGKYNFAYPKANKKHIMNHIIAKLT